MNCLPRNYCAFIMDLQCLTGSNSRMYYFMKLASHLSCSFGSKMSKSKSKAVKSSVGYFVCG